MIFNMDDSFVTEDGKYNCAGKASRMKTLLPISVAQTQLRHQKVSLPNMREPVQCQENGTNILSQTRRAVDDAYEQVTFYHEANKKLCK